MNDLALQRDGADLLKKNTPTKRHIFMNWTFKIQNSRSHVVNVGEKGSYKSKERRASRSGSLAKKITVLKYN